MNAIIKKVKVSVSASKKLAGKFNISGTEQNLMDSAIKY